MNHLISGILLLSTAFLGACTSTSKASPAASSSSATTPHRGAGLQIKLSTVYVSDQEAALRFYTEVLGFQKKDDFSNGGFRWLTITAPDDPDGAQLELALDTNPAGKAYQQALIQQNQPAVMFFTADLKAEAAELGKRGATLTMPPTEVTGSIIAQLKDPSGNLIQLTQLVR